MTAEYMDNSSEMTEIDYDGPSKSQLKRERLQLNKLAVDLCELPQKQFLSIPMNDILQTAVSQGREIRSHSARKRQIQYIGKLISRLDENELRAIHHQFDQLRHQSELSKQHFHKLETIRDQLIAGGDQQINDLLSQYPHFQRQQLRLLVRSAQKEKEKDLTPKSARQLFKYLRDVIQN